MSDSSHLEQFCQKLEIPYQPRDAEEEDAILCEFFIRMLRATQRGLSQPEAVQATLNLYQQWRKTKVKPDLTDWAVAQQVANKAVLSTSRSNDTSKEPEDRDPYYLAQAAAALQQGSEGVIGGARRIPEIISLGAALFNRAGLHPPGLPGPSPSGHWKTEIGIQMVLQELVNHPNLLPERAPVAVEIGF
jgi:hypothetical protein